MSHPRRLSLSYQRIPSWDAVTKLARSSKFHMFIQKWHWSPTSGVTDGGQRGESPPWQAKCKNGPRLAYVSVLVFLIFNMSF